MRDARSHQTRVSDPLECLLCSIHFGLSAVCNHQPSAQPSMRQQILKTEAYACAFDHTTVRLC